MKIIISTLAIFISIHCTGQEIKISNSSSSEKIRKTDLIQLVAGDIDPVKKICCTYQEYHGNIVSVSSDSIIFRTNRTIMSKNYADAPNDFEFNWNRDSNLNAVAKSDILLMRKYASPEAVKMKRRRTTFGALFVVTGLVTMANILFVSDNDTSNNTRNLLLAGGLQLGVGIVLGVSGKQKKYRFKNVDDPWSFE